MSLNRRNFIKLSGAGIAGSALFSDLQAQPAAASSIKKRKLIFRTLGKTGLKVPVISLPVERIDNENLVKEGINAGLYFFDTAHSYGQGRSEEFLGRIMQQYDRKKFIISTKISTRDKENPEKDLLAKFEKSLQRLQTDFVDILYLHAVDKREDVLNETYLKVFQDLKKQGKTRFIGVSTHKNMAEVLNAAVESNVWEVVLTTYNFRMENLPDVVKAVDNAAKAGLGIVAMKTMAGGFMDKTRTRKVNATAALKWVLNDKNITTTVPAITNFDMLEEDLNVMNDLKLTDQEALDLKENGSVSMFCFGCEECIPQCPKSAPIPEMMRAYMYEYGYNDKKLAREVIDGIADSECHSCPVCKVQCRNGFDIQNKAKDILRIKDVPREFLV